jgi:hypothetical protein
VFVVAALALAVTVELGPLPFDLADSMATLSTNVVRKLDQLKDILLRIVSIMAMWVATEDLRISDTP